MNRLITRYPLMEQATPPTGEGGSGEGGEQKQPTGEGGSGEGGEQKQPTGEGATLLDGDDDNAQGGEGGEGAENKAEPPTEEQVAEFCKGIPALDMGDGVKWDDATLKAIAPSLMEVTGGDAKKAQPIVKAYAEHMQKLAKAQAEAADAFNNGLIAECNKRFGADLKKVAGYAKKGGAAIFGDKIWNEMKTIPSFANNPDIMERLAEFGRKIATDGGKVTTKDGDPAPGESDVLHRMYGNVKV